MAWQLLPVDYLDAVWSGLKRYAEINNEDGTVSFQDVTVYSQKEKSFFGAMDANRMNEALNVIMSMLENGTDLYTAFQNYFAQQKVQFENTADATQTGFVDYTDALKAEGDEIIETIKGDYRSEMDIYESQQQQIFDAWFKAMQDQLSQDAAGNLQNQCTELDTRLSLMEQMSLLNEFAAPIAFDDEDLTLLVDDLDFAIMADWQYKEV